MQPTVNLFFAFKPPPGLCEPLVRLGATLKQAHALTGHSIGAGRLHVTLANCREERFSLEQSILRAIAVADAMSLRAVPVRLEWSDSFYHRPGQCPLVLRGGLEDLCAFRHSLRAAMMRTHFAVPANFTPHMTLVWANRCVGAFPIAPIRWMADELVLVKSLVGQARHIAVARWPLK